MRHNIHLFLGKDLQAFAKELKEYALTHGEQQVHAFFHTIAAEQADDGGLRLSRYSANVPADNDANEEPEVTEGVPEIIAGDELLESRLKAYFTHLFADVITIDNPGDTSSLLVTAYLPAYDEQASTALKQIAEAAKQSDCNYEMDVICVTHDTGLAIRDDKDTADADEEQLTATQKATLTWLAEQGAIVSHRIIQHVIPIQNTNSDGYSIGLNHESLLRLLGELALQSTENYYGLFKPGFDPEHEITGLGLSVLHLDREYFVKYLMRRTFLKVLNRENVTQSEVDINKIEPIAQKCIKNPDLERDFTRAFSKFWEENVVPLLDKKTLTHQDIISEVSPQAEDLFNTTIIDALQAYLPSEELSLPEKRCILALILGQDDNQLTNNIFSTEQCSIDDIVEEPLRLFVQENNLMPRGEDYDGEIKAPLDTPQDEHGNVMVPIETLRQMKNRMRDSTQFMRQLGSRMAELSKLIDRSADTALRLTDKGFTFDGTTYKLQRDVSEHAFDKTYEGHDNVPQAVDLRPGFMSIRDQGEQGSCSAFAVVSVFEYMLKTGGAKVNSNLSEAFVYYNTRKAKNKQLEDCGSSVYDTINTIHDLGVCTEDLCPYLATNYTTEPTAVAYTDAKQRLVNTAKSIALTSDTARNRRNLKSAIADGYPVIVSLRICNSFDAGKGFVAKPSAEEIKQESQGNHAMVICGYSEKEKFFIARNSWGTRFGNNGYCYLPYSYVEDPQLNIASFIITEVTVGDEKKGITAPSAAKMAVNFDTTDATIEYAVTSNLLDEEQRVFARIEHGYKTLQMAYKTLLTKLQNNKVRRDISNSAQRRLSQGIAKHEEEISKLQSKLTGELNLFDSATRQGYWYGAGFIALWIMISYLVYVTFGVSWQESHFVYWDLSVLGLAIVLMALWGPYRRSRRKQLIAEFMERIRRETDAKTHLEAEKVTSDMRFHLAGIFIDRFVDMQSQLMGKYHALRSMTGNLATWHDEEQSKISTMDAFTREPFIPVLDNASLDRFFEQKADEFTGDIKLYRYIDDFVVSAGGIVRLQADLRRSVKNRLKTVLADFTMFGYLNQPGRYPYLSSDKATIGELLPKLERKARPFVRYKQLSNVTPEFHCIKIATAGQAERKQWETIYPQYYSVKPDTDTILSPFRMLFFTIKPLQLSELMIMK